MKVIVCATGAQAVTTKFCATGVAAVKLPLPAWVAVRTTVPATPVRVTVLPETVAGPLTASVTARPELASGKTNVNGASHAVWVAMGANVIVWATGAQAATEFEGGITGVSGLADGNTVSLRGLLFKSTPNPVLIAKKVRKRIP